jgi:hypothetical protein
MALLQTARAAPLAANITIYTDSQASIDTHLRLRWCSATKWIRQDNRWLWRLWRKELQLRKAAGGSVRLIKVAAHAVEKGIEQSAFLTNGNEAADLAAKAATTLVPWSAELPVGMEFMKVCLDGVVATGDLRRQMGSFFDTCQAAALQEEEVYPQQGRIARAAKDGLLSKSTLSVITDRGGGGRRWRNWMGFATKLRQSLLSCPTQLMHRHGKKLVDVFDKSHPAQFSNDPSCPLCMSVRRADISHVMCDCNYTERGRQRVELLLDRWLQLPRRHDFPIGRPDIIKKWATEGGGCAEKLDDKWLIYFQHEQRTLPGFDAQHIADGSAEWSLAQWWNIEDIPAMEWSAWGKPTALLAAWGAPRRCAHKLITAVSTDAATSILREGGVIYAPTSCSQLRRALRNNQGLVTGSVVLTNASSAVAAKTWAQVGAAASICVPQRPGYPNTRTITVLTWEPSGCNRTEWRDWLLRRGDRSIFYATDCMGGPWCDEKDWAVLATVPVKKHQQNWLRGGAFCGELGWRGVVPKTAEPWIYRIYPGHGQTAVKEITRLLTGWLKSEIW